jgi:nitrogen fixation NifU-like protein
MAPALTHILVAAAVLILVVGLWMAVSYWLAPHVDRPDGKASMIGSCGDTMEISLRFKNGQVVDSDSWTNGCAYILNCVSAAAELAKGKTPEEIREIDIDMIQKSIGGLSREQMDCAKLSVETLHAALEDYMLKQGKSSGREKT